MKFEVNKKTAANAKMVGTQALKALVFTSLILVAGGAVGGPPAGGGGLGETGEKMCGFLENVNGLLNMGSALVVTIAVVIAGYQIAFAHKRISEVSPILIGGVLIGAAAQIANMVIGKDGGGQDCNTASITLLQIAQYYA